MAASVLGKRSRQVIDTEDITTSLPAPKRRTRCPTPQIFEDSENHSNVRLHRTAIVDKVLSGPQQGASRQARPTSGRNTRTKHTIHNVSIPTDTDRELLDADAACRDNNTLLFQDENLPPSVTRTPTTNRIRDVLGLKTPSTPKHRVRLAGTLLTPKASRTASPRPRNPSVFAAARQLFTQSSNSSQLVGRDTERRQLGEFITDAIHARSGGCTYVSGPPGTGKSAFVQDVFRRFENREDVKVSVVNCVSLRTSAEVYGRLSQDFAPQSAGCKTTSKQRLSKLFLSKPKSKSHLILLDEIDNLLDTDCDVLYTMFEWAMHPSSSIILVGIANALDLTDRFLPRLNARGLKPHILPFLPYTAAQISDIISTRLRSLLPPDTTADEKFVPFMQPAAVQLCGKKIASQTGDLRKAFSLVRRILEQTEREAIEKQVLLTPTKQPLGEVANLATGQASSSQSSSLKEPTCGILSPETAPRASIAHVARMASSIFNNGTLSRISSLNLQQKVVLCSLVSNEKHKAMRNPYVTPSKSVNKVPTVKELFVKYSMLCNRDEGLLQPLKDTEFRDVVASLETLGLVNEHKGNMRSSLLTPTSTPSRAGRSNDDKQIVSTVSEKEMRDSLVGAGADLLQRLLDEA